jgi:hypothetical protein
MKKFVRGIKYFGARELNQSVFKERRKDVYREEIQRERERERERRKKQCSDNQKISSQLQDFHYIAPKLCYGLEDGKTNSR